jgi:hypothetical protein
MRLSYMTGCPEACRPGSSHGNQIARTPIAQHYPDGLAERLAVTPEFL